MKRGIEASLIFLVLTLPLITASFLDLFKEDPQLSPQDFSVTVGNSIPVVNIISINGGSNVDLIQGAPTAVEIIFDVTDDNGLSDLDETTLSIQYTATGEATRSGTIVDCTSVDSGNTRTYTCSINMQHYDGEGSWTATVSIDDLQAATGQDTLIFTVNQLRAISLSPATISFGTVTPGGNDYTSPDTEVTNEGNYNVASNGLGITAYDLCDVGCSNTLGASNFNSGDQSLDPCTLGEIMIDSTLVPIPNFVLSRGNGGNPFPIRNISHCLDVPGGTTQATYSTTNAPSQSWDFAI